MISWQYWKAKLERAYSFRVQSGKITVCIGCPKLLSFTKTCRLILTSKVFEYMGINFWFSYGHLAKMVLKPYQSAKHSLSSGYLVDVILCILGKYIWNYLFRLKSSAPFKFLWVLSWVRFHTFMRPIFSSIVPRISDENHTPKVVR